MESFSEIFVDKPIIPVVTIEDVAHAVPVAKALLAGGLRLVEVTLRTPCALDAIKAIAQHVPEVSVAAGTIVDAGQFPAVIDAGARFAVSPGLVPNLVDAALAHGLPYLPGVATASEVQLGLSLGLEYLKFFPATINGGAKMLGLLNAVFPQIKFCPTGGISQAAVHEFFALPNVAAVGGSWITPAQVLADNNWAEVERLASAAKQ